MFLLVKAVIDPSQNQGERHKLPMPEAPCAYGEGWIFLGYFWTLAPTFCLLA